MCAERLILSGFGGNNKMLVFLAARQKKDEGGNSQIQIENSRVQYLENPEAVKSTHQTVT